MIDTLIFSSGGVSGISFIGCLQALEECGELENVKTIIGSSAGSIMALLIVLSYSSAEITNITTKINFASLFTSDLHKLEDINKELGFSKGKKLEKIIDLFIQHKYGVDKKQMTFQDLFIFTGIELIITTVCITTKTIEFFSHKTSPNMEVRLAIKMSCCIPILFSPVQWNEKLYIDGGIIARYPIDIIKYSQCGIGFHIHNDTYKKEETTHSNETTDMHTPELFGNFFSYITNLFKFVYDSSQQLQSEHPNIHTVNLHSNMAWYNPLDITDSKKQEIIAHGKEQTKKKLIELRLNYYDRISSVHKQIEECILKKSMLSKYFIRNL